MSPSTQTLDLLHFVFKIKVVTAALRVSIDLFKSISYHRKDVAVPNDLASKLNLGPYTIWVQNIFNPGAV